MKKIFNLLLVVVISTTIGCAQNENTGGDGQITFKDGMEFDFGTIPWDFDGNHEFVFKNSGKVPVLITNVKTSCGCTVPTYPKEPININENSSIKVHYDTKREGVFTKTITVYSNTSDSPITLVIKGEVQKRPVENGTGQN